MAPEVIGDIATQLSCPLSQFGSFGFHALYVSGVRTAGKAFQTQLDWQEEASNRWPLVQYPR